MNNIEGYAKAVYRGFHAMVRTAGDGEAKPIMGKGGEPEVFATEIEAVKAVNIHLLRYFNGHLVRDGEVAGQTKAEANAVFKGPLKQKGKTRVIKVSYRGQKEKCLPSREAKAQAEQHFATLTERST